jgi:beta-glucanase (GH16 family)
MRRRQRHSLLPSLLLVPLLCGPSAAVGATTNFWFDDFENDPQSVLDSWNVMGEKDCSAADPPGRGSESVCSVDNVRVDSNGFLVLSAREEAGSGRLTGARVTTFGIADMLYGTVTIKLSLPQGASGVRASAMLLPSTPQSTEWPDRGQIDFMDAINDMDVAVARLWFSDKGEEGGCGIDCGGITLKGESKDDFHEFKVEWTYKRILLSMDGELVCTREKWGEEATFPAPFDTSFHLVLDLSLGGSAEVDRSALPVEMRIDWARMELDPVAGRWQTPRGAPVRAFQTFLAVVGCIVGPYMALTGTIHPKANCFVMGALTGAFKAATITQLLSASTIVVITSSVACGLLMGYFSVHVSSIGRYKTVMALSISVLYFLLDLGLLLALGSRLAVVTLFGILMFTFWLVAYPEKHHFWAFFIATAFLGGCVLKLSIQQLVNGPVDLLKLLDDPMGFHCYVTRSCQSLLPVWVLMSAVGLAAQYAHLKLRPSATASALRKWRDAQGPTPFQQMLRRVRTSAKDGDAYELLAVSKKAVRHAPTANVPDEGGEEEGLLSSSRSAQPVSWLHLPILEQSI